MVKTAMAPNAWSLWLYRWDATEIEQGQKLIVRATDGTGARQTHVVREAVPDGVTGYHAVVVRRAED